MPNEITLSDFWIGLLLSSPSDSIYEISRTEPFRLKAVQSKSSPITPALMNRTIRTIIGAMEPNQPRLVRDFIDALRTVTPENCIQLMYKSSRYGETRIATILDLGPEHDRLYVHCRPEKA